MIIIGQLEKVEFVKTILFFERYTNRFVARNNVYDVIFISVAGIQQGMQSSSELWASQGTGRGRAILRRDLESKFTGVGSDTHTRRRTYLYNTATCTRRVNVGRVQILEKQTVTSLHSCSLIFGNPGNHYFVPFSNSSLPFHCSRESILWPHEYHSYWLLFGKLNF